MKQRKRRRVKPPAPSMSPLPQRKEGVRLDWKAYFYEFCIVHGEPVIFKENRLLFRDGWMYSATDYEGPEFPPPHNNQELDALVLQYWTIRKSQLTTAVTKLHHQIKTAKDAQATRNIPLQQTTYIQDGDRRRRTHKPLDLSGIESRIQWIEADLIECEERLREIQQYHEEESRERS